MRTAFFSHLTSDLPLILTRTLAVGPHQRNLYWNDPEDRGPLHLSREPGGRVALSWQGEHALVVDGGPLGRGWGKIASLLSEWMTFPATERLFWAIGEADLDAAAVAIQEGADIKATNEAGFLPLDALSISFGCRADVVRIAFEHQARGADDGEHVLAARLHEASSLFLIRCLLLEAGAIDQSAFRDAMRSGDLVRAGEELSAGASIDAITLNRVPLLIERILHRDLAGVSWLLERGACPDWEPPAGCKGLPVFLSRALPTEHAKLGDNVILTARTAARIVGFPEVESLLRKVGGQN